MAGKRAFLTLLLDAVEQAVIATDSTGQILHWNRFAERLYGWRSEEVVGLCVADVLLPEELRHEGREVISAVCRRETNTPGEWLLKRRDGTRVPVRVASTPILDDGGKVVGIVGVSWDISERKRLQEELHRSEIRLRFFAEQLPALAWATDQDLNVIWNQGAALRGFNTDPRSFIGKTIAEAVRLAKGRPEAVDAHRRALAGETVAYEGGRNGFVLQAVVQPFRDSAGRIAGTIGVALDITDRKRAEEASRRSQKLLVEAEKIGQVASFEVDVPTGVWSWSDQFFRILGFEPQQFPASYEALSDLVHRDDRSLLRARTDASLEKGAPFDDVEYRITREDGTERVLHSRGEVTRDGEGRPLRMVGVVHDITDRKRAERELHEKREQLQALSRRLLEAQEAERRAIARELHDDFGQVLSAVRLQLQTVKRRHTCNCEEHLAESVALVDQAIERVRSLALELRPSILDDLGLVSALRWLLKRQAERAGFESAFEVRALHGRLPSAVETCCFRVAQEALTNIARHAKTSHVKVELREDAAEIEIVVRDDGRGFDVRAASERAARGESLGLLSMRERVSLAGGRMELESTPGRGTTLRARFPIGEEAE